MNEVQSSIGSISFKGYDLGSEELSRRIEKAATGLREQFGVATEKRVALLLKNHPAFIEASLACARLGASAVPINWHGTEAEVRHVLGDCEPQVVIAHREFADRLGGWPEEKTLWVSEAASAKAATAPLEERDWYRWLEPWKRHTGAAITPMTSVIYTSGTTGVAKGVARNTPRGEQIPAMKELRRRVYGFEPGMRSALIGPAYHSGPNVHALGIVAGGGFLEIFERFDPEALLRCIEEKKLTNLTLAPIMFVRLLRLPQEVRSKYDLSSLRFVTHAAAPCPPEVKRQMIEWWGTIIHEYYGCTEALAVTACSSEEWLRKPGTVGRVLPGTRLAIRADDGTEAGPYVAGEILARRESDAGFVYINRPEETEAVLRGGLVATGDVGYLDEDGYLFVSDRKRDMVISGGVNIYPAEIEAALLLVPGVRDCAVFGVPDAEFGESLLACVEPMPSAMLSEQGLQAALRESLAGFKVPRQIRFMDDLPREDSGKIFKRKLREPYWASQGRTI